MDGKEDEYDPPIPIVTLRPFDCGTYEIYCSCGIVASHDTYFSNPDYASQPHFDNLLRVLFGDDIQSEALWMAFSSHVKGNYYYYDFDAIRNSVDFTKWLFHPDHRDRFLHLFLGFLELEDVQREFGWEECPECKGKYIGVWHKTGFCEHCTKGKLMRPWLRVMKESNNGTL
jgi:hypothetical protein